ncbi:MAG: outer membrane beta-barrel protein [Vulcanimicrobiaceae bacterium]
MTLIFTARRGRVLPIATAFCAVAYWALLRGIAYAAPAPSPSPTPSPAVSVSAVYTFAAFHTYGINPTGALDTPTGSDLHARADIANLLLNLNAVHGRFSAGATIGEYAFPTLGAALNPTLQAEANTSLYGALPLVDLTYAPNAHLSISIGKLATLLGQESAFTYQNVTIERGTAWALEPTISRAARLTYTNGPWSAALEDDDGYYSARYGGLQWQIGYAPNTTTNVSFAAILPRRNATPNATTGIANKAEYDFMLSRQIGKLQLEPYLLLVHSPASVTLGYPQNSDASAAVLLGSYALSSMFSAGFRYEYAHDRPAVTPDGANADLLGYGPGSLAQTFTVTPTYRRGDLFMRLEFARISLGRFSPGFGFGAQGMQPAQTRIGFEMGVVK